MFADRQHAGFLLAKEVVREELTNTLILGITRGGVVVAKEVARVNNLPLDFIVCKKIGAPGNPELALGAVGPEKTVYRDEYIISRYDISETYLREKIAENAAEQKRQDIIFLAGRKHKELKNRTVILVDDGIATGATVLCAQAYLRKKQVGKLILAVPCIGRDTLKEIILLFDGIITLQIEDSLQAVGQLYREFSEVSEEEVINLLDDG